MVKTPDIEIYNIAQCMSNAHTIEAGRVHPFNSKLPKSAYAEMVIYSVGPQHDKELCTLARKCCLHNNPHTFRIRLSTDVVFYIFKVSHSHALFRFRLHLELVPHAEYSLFWEEEKQITIHTRVMGGPASQLFPGLGFHRGLCLFQMGILANLFSP